MGPKVRPRGSLSLGDTSNGRLLRGAKLPLRGPHHQLLPGYGGRNTRYATEEMVALLHDLARAVARRYRGSRLMVGNLSRRGGGNLKWSVSHNCGRDADVAFYVRRRGKPVPAPKLVTIGKDLRSVKPRGYRFDVARNWALVEAAVTHPRVHVQWMFIAHHLRAALLSHARKRGVSAAVLAKAERVLKQPSDSLSHADHIHLRIYCSRADRLAGCRDRLPFWPGVPTYTRAVAARIRMLLPGLRDADARVRRRTMLHLARLEARRAAPHLARLLRADPDARNRRRAYRLLRRWRADSPAVYAELRRVVKAGGPGAPLAYALVEHLGKRRGVPILARGLRSERKLPGPRGGRARIPEAWLAVRAARGIDDLRLVSALIAALSHSGGRIRREAAHRLRRLTNHSYGYRWRNRRGRRLKRQVRRWRGWWAKNRRRGRPALVVRGFRRLRRRARRRFDLRKHRTVRWLVALTLRRDYLGENADYLLHRLSGLDESAPSASSLRRHRRWNQWYRKRYRRQIRRARARARARAKRRAKRRARRREAKRRKARARKTRARKTRARKTRARKARARKAHARKTRARKARARKARARKTRARKTRARKARARRLEAKRRRARPRRANRRNAHRPNRRPPPRRRAPVRAPR